MLTLCSSLLAIALAAFPIGCSSSSTDAAAPALAPASGDAPATPAPVQSESPPACESSEQREVRALLDELERAAGDLETFTANLIYQKQNPTIGRIEEWGGVIVHEIRGEDAKRLAVLFDRKLVGSRQRDIREQYVFDGIWLVQKDYDSKTFIKRQIVPPGEEFDPLKLGEGPFPLPIGQARSEVLKRFEVSLANVPEEGVLKNLRDVRGLRLVPRPDTPEAEEFQSVEIFYDAETLLPIGVATVAANPIDPADPNSRERKTVLLLNAQRNTALTDEQRALLTVDEPDPSEWSIEITPWQ